MTIDDYRVEFAWSKSELAKRAGIDMSTLRNAIDGIPVYRTTIGKITNAINQELLRRGQFSIRYTDLDGVQFAD